MSAKQAGRKSAIDENRVNPIAGVRRAHLWEGQGLVDSGTLQLTVGGLTFFFLFGVVARRKKRREADDFYLAKI